MVWWVFFSGGRVEFLLLFCFLPLSLSTQKCVEILKHLIMSNIKKKKRHILAEAGVILCCVLRNGSLWKAVLPLFSGEAFVTE